MNNNSGHSINYLSFEYEYRLDKVKLAIMAVLCATRERDIAVKVIIEAGENNLVSTKD